MLAECLAVLYTPSNEHFGIVPIEAMFAQKPVIAVNSGGPLETVLHEKTGFLCDPDPTSFAKAMQQCLSMSDEQLQKIGSDARQWVHSQFSIESFTNKLDRYFQHIVYVHNHIE
mmetsp:Transcript_349/g.411  ORF Transcript_349/g.411 Transcript_349/m.411 type:complete len:114 (-) Transcript_349:46-387(-)